MTDATISFVEKNVPDTRVIQPGTRVPAIRNTHAIHHTPRKPNNASLIANLF
jgi:hypothetical protein